jgi:hypothetical protein
MLGQPSKMGPMTTRLDRARRWWTGGATPARRRLAMVALASVVGAVAASLWLWIGDASSGAAATEEDALFAKLRPGDCLGWPQNSPDRISVVDCDTEHRFEVAGSQSADPSRLAASPGTPQPQIDHELCQAVVGRYLGPRYDPDGLYTVGVLWSAETPTSHQRIVCGLQLPGLGGQQSAFKGRVADLDQSKVWPAGTCLGVNPSTNQSTDIPIDCSDPHGTEVTGMVDLRAAFTGTLPADAEQDAFITDNCTRVTGTYLRTLAGTGLTIAHPTIAPASWTAGSREVACRIGAQIGDGRWATLVGTARGPLSVNGQTPSPATKSAGPSPEPSTTVSTTSTHVSTSTVPPRPSAVPHATQAPGADSGDATLGPAPGPGEGTASSPSPEPPAPPPSPVEQAPPPAPAAPGEQAPPAGPAPQAAPAAWRR